VTRPRSALLLAVAAVLTAALAGCGGGGPDEPAQPTRAPVQAPTPTPTPATTLASGFPRHVGNDGTFQIFEVTAQQRELVARNAVRVLARDGLSDRGVRFGITDQFKQRHMVLIDPGLSGLSAREILDRMLGGG
jgi:hypothetical protein